MDDLIIGEGLLELNKLTKEMEKSKSFVLLVENWKQFGDSLGINDVKLLDLERKIKIGDVQLNGITREILRLWKAENGVKATLQVLHDALLDRGLRDIAEVLLTKLWKPEPREMAKFVWRGREMTLENLLGEKTSMGVYKRIIKDLRKYPVGKPLPLFKHEVIHQDLPKFYVPRTISCTLETELKQTIFCSEATKNHVFIFKDITKAELAKVTGYQSIEESGKQLYSVSVRYILLECSDDFHRICRGTSKPVHLIQHKEQRFFWIQSSKGLDVIRNFLKNQENWIIEEDLVAKIQSFPSPYAISIAESPGMGKTLLLANLASKIQLGTPCSECVVFFINFLDLIGEVRHMNSSASAIERVAEYASCDSMTKLVVEALISSNAWQFYILLDGYDEVQRDKLDQADLFLRHLHEVPSIKLVLTTRHHLRTRLENIHKHFSFEILPFNHSNQVEFLTKYWTEKHKARPGKVLEEFAKQCLTALATKLTDKERTITGVPLQCMMLAEVFAEDAVRASIIDRLPEDTVRPISFFEMYKNLLDKKFERIAAKESNFNKEHYLDHHVFESIRLLFPEWIEIFKPILQKCCCSEIKESTLYSIGVIEKTYFTKRAGFVHRTFAEYLLAEFIVNNLSKHRACVKLLFGEILGQKGVTVTESIVRPTRYDLNCPVIAYFIEMQLQFYLTNHCMDDLLFSYYSRTTKFNDEDICVAAAVCCSHNLQYTFEYASKVLHHYRIWSTLRDKYFKDLPHSTIEKSMDVTMLKKLLNFVQMEWNLDVSYHVFNPGSFYDHPWIYECSPLHVAVWQGKYNVVTFLLTQYGVQVLNLKHLLHSCLHESARNTSSVIADKMLIIDLLAKINRGWLEEEYVNHHNRSHKPMLEKNVHLKLLQRLVECGANINAYSSEHGTVLHRSGDKETYIDLTNWALSSGFRLINHSDWIFITPLMEAIRKFGALDDQILKLFYDKGCDFNASDLNGDSVLFHALRSSECVNFVRNLLDYGANVNHTNKGKENAAHLIVANLNNPKQALRILRLLKSRGFILIRLKDLWGRTPLDNALKTKKSDDELVKFLRGN